MAATAKGHERGQLDDCIDIWQILGSSITVSIGGIANWCWIQPPNSLVG